MERFVDYFRLVSTSFYWNNDMITVDTETKKGMIKLISYIFFRIFVMITR